jgi:DNA-binding LacI/PurR family transcriptional regulator
MASPTLVDVAKRANVSKSTVSLVLNHNERIPPETAERVWQAARELNYVPSRAARSLQSGRSRMLGLIVSDITNPYFSELTRTVASAAAASHYDLVTLDTDYDPNLLSVHLDHLRTHRIDGLFIFTTERDLQILPQLEQANLPAVLLNWGMTGKKVGEIAVQYRPGIAALLDHLIEFGHRRLAFVAGPALFFSATGRAEAFRLEVELRRRVLEEPLYLQSDFRLGEQVDTAIVNQILSMDQAQRPTVVVTSNDLMAISLLRAFYGRRVAVPDQVSVTGMDDIVFSNYTTPSLTTLRLPRRQMGLYAFDMLQRLMEGTSTDGPDRTTVSMRLIVRESTGPAPSVYGNSF